MVLLDFPHHYFLYSQSPIAWRYFSVKKKNRFYEWIISYRVNELAELLGVHRVQIYDWRVGKHSPGLLHAARILELADGKVSLRDLMEPFEQRKQKATGKNNLTRVK